MGIKDTVVFGASSYATSSGGSYMGGLYYNGYIYVLSFNSSENTVYLTKSDVAGNRLWELPFYSSETWYAGDGYDAGAPLICNGRIYYKNQINNTICWVPFSDPIVPNQTPTKILDCGGGEADYHSVGQKYWFGNLIKGEYIFHIERDAHTILVTDLDGNFIGRFGEYGTDLGQFTYPSWAMYYPPNRIYTCEFSPGRKLTEWRVESWRDPFVITPVAIRLDFRESGHSYDHLAGCAYRNNQFFLFHFHPAWMGLSFYRIEEDFSLVYDSSIKIWYPGGGSYNTYYGLGVFADNSKVVSFPNHGGAVCAFAGTITAIENGLDEDFSVDIYAMISGVGIDINFSLESGIPQAFGDLSFELTAEGYTQQNTLDEKFFFSAEGLCGHYDMIADFGFNLLSGEYGARDAFGFDLFASQNYLEQTFGFELYTETSITKFSELEETFGFELLASSPHSGKLSLELETFEFHSLAATDLIADCQLTLEPLSLFSYESPTSTLVFPSLEVDATASVPAIASSNLILPKLSITSTLSAPISVSAELELENLVVSGFALVHGQLNGNLILPLLTTQGIVSMGASTGQLSAVLNNVQIQSWAAVVPSVTGNLVIPAMNISASQTVELYSISELYDGSSIIHISDGNYSQVDLSSLPELEEDLFDIQGIAVNLRTTAISKIGYPSDYNVIDLGYLDIHKGAVNDYLVFFLFGDMPTQENLIGRLIVGDYSYEIKRWISEGEWRVVVGKGITKRFFRDPSKRYQRVVLQLKKGFELKGLSVLATPNPRRLR